MVNRRPYFFLTFMNQLLLLIVLTFPVNTQAKSWKDLWFTADQQGMQALNKGDPKLAAQFFKNELWRGVAYYRAGEYQKAAEVFAKHNTPIANYNRGNALAKLGYYQEAIDAYNKTLQQAPKFSDAKYNRDLLKKLLQQQKNSQQQNQNNKQQNKNSDKNKENQNSKSQPQQQANSSQQNNKNQQANNQVRSSTHQEENKNNSSKKNEKANSNSPQTTNQQQDKQSTNQLNSKNMHPSDLNKLPMQKSINKNQEKLSPSFSNIQPQAKAKNNVSDQKVDASVRQWIQQIPDDPGGLLKQKFLRDHLRIQMQQEGIL